MIIVVGLLDSLLPETVSSFRIARRAVGCFGLIKNFKSLLGRPVARAQSTSTIPFVRKPSIIAANAEYSSSSHHSTSSFTSSESSIVPMDSHTVRAQPQAQHPQQKPQPQPQPNMKPKLREIGCLHGIRFISFFFIILYHTFTGAQVPSANLLSLMRAELSFLKQLITNAALWVDTFFLLGGFLSCHTLLSRASPNDTVLKHFLEHPKRLFHRYIRLTPSVAGMISFSIFVEALGSGPIWYQYLATSSSTCHKNWFLPLVYLNNLINLNQLGKAPSECLSYLWYLGVDIQFFLISPVLIAFLANRSLKYQRIGVFINLTTIIASCSYTYWLITKDNLTPTVLVTV